MLQFTEHGVGGAELTCSLCPQNLGREGDSPSLTRRLRLRWERNLPKVTQQSGLELRLLFSRFMLQSSVSTRGKCVLRGTCGNVWIHVRLSQHGQGLLLASGGGEAGGAAEHPTMHRTSRPGECQDCQGPELPLQWFSAWATQQTHLGDLTIPIPRLPPQPFISGSLGVGPQCQVFLKACQMVPMCSQDCSKPLILGVSAPFVGPRGRSTKPIWVVQSTATLC